MPLINTPTVNCPKCSAAAELRDNAAIYNGVSYGLAYICGNFPRCDTYVGANRRTLQPLGTMADKETRGLRQICHSKFDLLWKAGTWTRTAAYAWLGAVMGLDERDAHIAMFDAARCRQLLSILETQAAKPSRAKTPSDRRCSG